MQFTTDLRLEFPVRSQQVERPNEKDPTKTDVVWEPIVFAYHTPISTETFNANYRLIADTKHALFGQGIQYAYENGQRIATLTLKDNAKYLSAIAGTKDPGPAFLAEIKRLTMIMCPTAGGFDTLPVDTAIQRNVIAADDWEEAEASIVFFTCAFAMAPKSGREPVARSAALVLRGSMTALTATEYAASLTASTPATASTPSSQ